VTDDLKGDTHTTPEREESNHVSDLLLFDEQNTSGGRRPGDRIRQNYYYEIVSRVGVSITP